MTQLAPQEAESGFVEANLVYTVDTGEKPVNETMPDGDMSRRNTGTFENHTMVIRDGRPLRDQFSLEETGFEFIDHATAVTNFYDPEHLKSVYYPEIEALIKARTGAARVLVFDHTLRSGDEDTRNEKKLREPVMSVHNDYTEWSGPQRVRDLLPADEAEALLEKRFAIVQVWRPIRNPIQSNPLAICDARTLSADSLIASERRFPHRVGETYRISYDAGQRWFYFPNMRRDEALIFKVFESETDGRARFTAHTSFVDPNTPADAPPRESIEMRAFAFF
ncbi:MAG: CmcJ/NvfI family oxidoreductase [Alphaproteobacteria bacterium]|nr:CmcJ/NvfI family oxidoreductase [Alphaproteobacteria bacterium]